MIAIIPARGGSKGLPGKNIKELNGLPLIAYTVQAAKTAGIGPVYVTTDDEAIAQVAQRYGAQVPFLRPGYLASDTASAIDVYLHAVEFLSEKGGCPIEKFMVLLPTTPFRGAGHIQEAYQLFVEEQADTLVSVTKADTPPSWYLYQDKNSRIHSCGFGLADGFVSNRQMDGGYYIPNGAVYILDYQLLKQGRTYYSDNTIAYVMGRRDSVDIDTADDFDYAEYLMKSQR